MSPEEMIKKRLLDLATTAYRQNIYTYTNFLNASELSLYSQMARDLSFIGHSEFGGSDLCERKVIAFGSEDELGYPADFPIRLIKISPLAPKFANTLTHRDFLGSLMNLGIERNTLGDIFIKGNMGFVYCLSNMAPYIVEHLEKVKHTHIQCRLVEMDIPEIAPVFTPLSFTVASNRIDTVVSSLTKLSRNKAAELFLSKKIFLNGTVMENHSYLLKPDDVISIRGYGKFIYKGIEYTTKKSRLVVQLLKYT